MPTISIVTSRTPPGHWYQTVGSADLSNNVVKPTSKCGTTSTETYKFVVNSIPNEEQSSKTSSANGLKPCFIQATATFGLIFHLDFSQHAEPSVDLAKRHCVLVADSPVSNRCVANLFFLKLKSAACDVLTR